jgi:hypothetical protein
MMLPPNLLNNPTRRQRWDVEVYVARQRWQEDCVAKPLGIAVELHWATRDIMYLRLLAAYKPLLEALTRIERTVALIPDGHSWPMKVRKR